LSIDKKTELEIKKAKYSRIKLLFDEAGWNDIKELLVEEYANLLDKAKNSDDAEARGALKFIDKFFDMVDSDYKLGEYAQKEYIKKYTNISQGE
jgi:hypothetical protein